jgi:hypothetical protein
LLIDVLVVARLALNNRPQAANGGKPAAPGQPIGHDRNLERAGNPGNGDPLVEHAVVLERRQRAVQEPPRHHLIVPRDDDRKRVVADG